MSLLLQIVYNVVTYAGYVGVLSGQRPKGFSITVDERGEIILYFIPQN